MSIVEAAQSNLKSKNSKYKQFKLKENYLYVRITPKTSDEYDMINSDSTINTFNRPLDYEIKSNGNKYRDPEIKDYGFGSIYCVIPTDKKFKNINYDLLEKLYIPFGSGGNDKESKRLEKLEDTNLKILDDEILESTGFKTKNKKR